MTQEDLKMIEARWKSDVDKKLDALAVAIENRRIDVERRIDKFETSIEHLVRSVDELNGVLATGKGGVDMLFLMAKLAGAFTVIGSALAAVLYLIRNWPK